MLVGLPGSGKSTLAEKYKESGYKVHSSDAIREELGEEAKNETIFQILHKRIKEDLKKGHNCIYDATNIRYKRRKDFLQQLKKIDCFKTCVVVATPYEVCLYQNNVRENVVPHNVIERMYRQFDIPYYYEGWNTIRLYYAEPYYKHMYKNCEHFIRATENYDQKSKYHNETLGEHSKKCAEYVDKYWPVGNSYSRFWNLLEAAFLHDCGKPFCRTFIDSKGELTLDSAHYYNHEHVGSYNSLFYQIHSVSEQDHIYIAALIRWHMQMFFINKQPKLESKYHKLLGDSLYDDLVLLTKCDQEASK